MHQLRRLAALAAAFALSASLGAAAGTAARPNIVLILSDDHGWADVGWHSAEIRTPNLDKLAHAGARLEQFYAQPACSPTRAALMTGRYPMRHGLQLGVIRPWADHGLPLEERTLAQLLAEAGYTTAICGKWHLGHHAPAYLPEHRGFAHQYGLYTGETDYFTHRRDGGFDWHRDGKVEREPGYTTFLIAHEAIRLIREQPADQPLFLYVPFNAVHVPLQVPENYKEPYSNLPPRRRTYAGMVAAEDEAIGQIVAAVEAKGIRDNTLIVWASDNGGPEPIADGRPSPHDAILLNAAPTTGAIRMGNWKLVLNGAAGDAATEQATTPGADGAPQPLVAKTVELFDLAQDISETTNLADAHPEKVQALRARYDRFAREAVLPRNKPRAPGWVVPKIWGEPDAK